MKKILILLIALCAVINVSGQWNGDYGGIPIVPEGTSMYDNEAVVGPDGTTYFLYYHPDDREAADEYDTDNVVYEYRLQAIDKYGVKKFGDLGILISDYPNRSYCVYNNYLYVDDDGNIIVVVTDSRDGAEGDFMGSYAYKLSPDGEMLWDEEGITLDWDRYLVAAMQIIELADGSYVFAWMSSNDTNPQMLSIYLQRITADGEPQWDIEKVSLCDDNIIYQYPYLVDAGMNQFILVYAKGGAQDLYARKIDFDGTSVWGDDVRFYRGGWGSIPLWTILDVQPSGDGGVIVGWNDDRDYDNIETAYMAYVTGNGEIGFSAASDEGDVKLSYDEYKHFNCRVMADPAGDGFLAFWRETSSSQSWQRMMIQKVSKQGELLYGDEGIVVVDMEQTAYGYNSLQAGNDGEAMLFFMRQNSGWGDVDVLYSMFNTTTGELITDEPYILNNTVLQRSSLDSDLAVNDDFWILTWDEEYEDENNETKERHMIQRIEFDGSIYTDVQDILVKSNGKFYHANGQFSISVNENENANIEIFDVKGSKIDNISNIELNAGLNTIAWTNGISGVYIAKLSISNEVLTCKILIK